MLFALKDVWIEGCLNWRMFELKDIWIGGFFNWTTMISYYPSIQIFHSIRMLNLHICIMYVHTLQISHWHGSSSVSSNKAFLMETCSANSSQKIGCNCTGISFSIWRYFLLQVRHIPAGKLLLLSMKSGNSLQIIGILPSLIRLRFDFPKHPRHTWKYIIWTFFASNAHVLILSY